MKGKRNVRVGYVIENPIWKTSYRLVLGKEKEDKPFLQGWAVVENATDEDWKDVRMALVAGRPISFQMDLYTPLYVPRPTVVPELFASLRPVTYNGDMSADKLPAMAASRQADGAGQAARLGHWQRIEKPWQATNQPSRSSAMPSRRAWNRSWTWAVRAFRRWRRRRSWATSSSTPSTSR